MRNIQIITDGACKPNPGKGGWAALICEGDSNLEIFGSSPQTTNNRMEMTAAIEALKLLPTRCVVEVVTDSSYLKNGMTQWIHNWKRNGMLTKEGNGVLNGDLWSELDTLAAQHEISWTWVKGHAKHAGNNRCDELASNAALEQSHWKEVVTCQ